MVVHLLNNKVEKQNFFFEKIFVFFTKYTLLAEKNVFIWKKCFITKMLLLKNTEKYK